MSERGNKAVIIWLFAVAALVGLMVVVGGYVRLTRAGLSIVEWNPISGVVPPIGEQAWQQEFAKYQQTPEFRFVNAAMTLDGYKHIFYLEWAHRLIARLAGLIVVLPLIYFLWKGIIPWRKSAVYLLIALLFAFQGFMGWYMVSSGLIDQPHVNHFRLTIHLLIALTLLAVALWVGLDHLYRHGGAARPRWSGLGLAALTIIVVQIAYGGLVAGLKAGHISNTWPLMGGALVPSDLFSQTGSWLARLLEAPLTVHFIHRWLAFGVLAIALWLYFHQGAGKASGAGQIGKGDATLVIIVLMQIGLGISVVVFGVPIWLALLHQTIVLLIFITAVYLNHRLAWARGSENG